MNYIENMVSTLKCLEETKAILIQDISLEKSVKDLLSEGKIKEAKIQIEEVSDWSLKIHLISVVAEIERSN